MSFILVTYGYNQYSIFNTNTSTPTLIDNMKTVALNNIIKLLNSKDSSLQKEIESSLKEEENLNKMLKAHEQDLKIEEDKYNEAKKALEDKIKKEEKKKEKEKEKEETEKKNAKDKGKEKKETATKKKEDTKNIEDQLDNKAIVALQEKIQDVQNQLTTLNNNKEIKMDKKKKLGEILIHFKKQNKSKMKLIIDLIDSNGEVMNLNENLESLANEILENKTVYELNYIKIPDEEKIEEKKKEEKKEEEKKEEEKKEEKKKEEKKDKKNEEQTIPTLEPLKFDGYCMRSIEEDAEFEEDDKNKDKKDKKGNKKK